MGEQVEKPPEEKKPEEAPANSDEKKPPEESKDTPPPPPPPSPPPSPPPPPPPPPEIVLRVFMHCEGCARKVRRCLKGFDGVEDVLTDCKTHKVIVKGEKADPLKVLERVQKKSHRTVELLSPVAKPPAGEVKVEEKEAAKPEEKKEEPPQVVNVIVKVNMHCEACAQVIRKRIMRMKGVESAETDLKNSQVNVKGTFDPQQLVDYIHKRTGKQAIVVKQDPEPKKEDEKVKEDKKDSGEKKEEKPVGDAAGDSAGDGKEIEKDKEKEKENDEKKTASGGDQPADGGPAGGDGSGGGGGGSGGGDDLTVVDLRKNEFHYYHPANYQIYPSRYTAEWAYGYPPAPQMFSDENPNACTVM